MPDDKRHPYILHWDDERSIGNSLIVTLKPGRAFEPHPDERVAAHVAGFDTVKEAMRAVRQARRCPCEDCRAAPLDTPYPSSSI